MFAYRTRRRFYWGFALAWSVIRIRWRFVLAVVGLTMAIVIARVETVTRLYSSCAVIEVNGLSPDGFLVAPRGFTKFSDCGQPLY